MSSLLWKIGGEAGFGIMTTGLDFAKLASKLGYHIADYADYPSLIRGGHNTYEVHVSGTKVRSSKNPIDILVCLNKATYTHHKHRLHAGSVVIYDKEMFTISDKKLKPYHLPLKKTLKEENASTVMMNTMALAASMAILDWPLEELYKVIVHAFSRKGEVIVEMNKAIARKGYEYIKTTYPKATIKGFEKKTKKDKKLIMTGNDAFALGAVIGDCHLYVAYPMTPSSTVLTRMAKWAETTGMVVRHAEDEISVVNTAIGGSFAGARAACGTSGGGFALMTESVSLTGITEIPLVIFIAQRPGPATGLPTWTEQGDLLFTVHAGHGEFPKIVLAPGDVEEMYMLSAEAFNIADMYQTPVIVMSDKHLAESHWSTSKMALDLFTKTYRVDRGKITSKVKEKKYLRYQNTKDGISPMLIPGQKGRFFQANSYEHSEDGHSIESAQLRIEQVDKRNRKLDTYLKNHFQMPKIYGNINKSNTVFVAWGSTKGVILDAMEILSQAGKETALIHFTHVYPLDEGKILKMFAAKKKYVLVENNSLGQFGQLLRQHTGIDFKHKLLKYDGRQLYIEDIIQFVEKI